MFVRTVTRKHSVNVSVQIVESFRNDDGKPRQRIIEHMGSVRPGSAVDALRRLAEKRKRELLAAKIPQPALFPPETLVERTLAARRRRADKPLPIADARKLAEEQRMILGFHEVFGAMYDKLELDQLWTPRQRVSERVFRQAVLMRLARPGRSKRAHATDLDREFGVPLPLGKLYRMMDRLTERRIAALEGRVAGAVRGLLDERIEVVFADATTLAFASEVEDDLRRKGYSKDGKPHRVQVVLALLQTEEGLPLGYRVFPGNTADVRTLLPLVEELQQQYRVGRRIVVADAGMASTQNLDALTAAGFDWVLAASLRKLPEGEVRRLRQASGWEPDGTPDAKDREPRLFDHTVGGGRYRGRRLIVRHCPKKARKDARDRERAVAKARKRLAEGIRGKGRAGRFLTIRQGAVTFNDEAVARDALFDGFHAVLTNLSDPPATIRAHYAQLWSIEYGFRVLKSTLAVRPVFHWTERRVRAHIAICYLAFALLRIFRWRFRRHHAGHPPPSEETILHELALVQGSLVRDGATSKRYLIPSAASNLQRMLYSTVGLSLPRTTVLVSTPNPGS